MTTKSEFSSLSLSSQRFQLTLRAVHVQCIDDTGLLIPGAFGSGFVRWESDGLWLYTCWHLVTGFESPYEPKIESSLPNRRALRVTYQPGKPNKSSGYSIGGTESIDIPLYESQGDDEQAPVWLQDKCHVPNPYLNHAGYFVPYWHDAVKIPLPPEATISAVHAIADDECLGIEGGMLVPGEPCVVVGYPFGFSARGPNRPIPITLTRFMAAIEVAGRPQVQLLDGDCAPGMSGGPVFAQRGEHLKLFGIYTGNIWPRRMAPAADSHPNVRDQITALGTVSNLSLLHHSMVSFMKVPDEPRQWPPG